MPADGAIVLPPPLSPWPSYTAEEVEAVARVLRSNRVNYWTGDECRQFEQAFARWSGAAHAIALVNGTLALEIALRGLGIGHGDEVVVTPRSFFASASCVVNVGARPVFADVCANTQNLTATTVRAALSSATRAIVCVHLAGMPCDMDPILALAREHKLKVIEDCAQAHGARYRGRSVGSLGDVGAWSFCQDKIMSTGGEGGMLTTSDPDLWKRMWSYKEYGKSYDTVHQPDVAAGFRWQHESFGTNGRMLEMQAVIGRIQLERMRDWHALRTANAARLAAVCRRFDAVRVPAVDAHSAHAYYRFYAFVRPANLAPDWSRDRIVQALVDLGVPCQHGTCAEIYREQAFVRAGLAPAQRLPVARQLGQTSLALPVHPTLTDADLAHMCAALEQVLGAATRR